MVIHVWVQSSLKLLRSRAILDLQSTRKTYYSTIQFNRNKESNKGWFQMGQWFLVKSLKHFSHVQNVQERRLQSIQTWFKNYLLKFLQPTGELNRDRKTSFSSNATWLSLIFSVYSSLLVYTLNEESLLPVCTLNFSLPTLSKRNHFSLPALSKRNHFSLPTLSKRNHFSLPTLSKRNHFSLLALSKRSKFSLLFASSKSSI